MSWTIRLDAQPFLLTRPLQYPPSEIYDFVPLNERVEVYQKPFRLLQDLSLSTAADARKALSSVTELTITGTLEYQACDDSSCFLPQNVPLSYRVDVRPLDAERANVSRPPP